MNWDELKSSYVSPIFKKSRNSHVWSLDSGCSRVDSSVNFVNINYGI